MSRGSPPACARSPVCPTRSGRCCAATPCPTVCICASSECRSASIGMIYEGRPNVTVDAFGLALKSGNAVLLRGSSSAARSNQALVQVLRASLVSEDLPADAVQLLSAADRSTVTHLIQARGLVDVVIPRGGASLIDAVVRDAQVPTIETGVGNCHVYVHEGGRPGRRGTDPAELQDPPAQCLQRRRDAAGRRRDRRARPCPGWWPPCRMPA